MRDSLGFYQSTYFILQGEQRVHIGIQCLSNWNMKYFCLIVTIRKYKKRDNTHPFSLQKIKRKGTWTYVLTLIFCQREIKTTNPTLEIGVSITYAMNSLQLGSLASLSLVGSLKYKHIYFLLCVYQKSFAQTKKYSQRLLFSTLFI